MKKKRDLGLLWFYIIDAQRTDGEPADSALCEYLLCGTPYDLWLADAVFVAGILVRRDDIGFSMGCASPEIVGLDPVSKGHPARQAGRAGEVTG